MSTKTKETWHDWLQLITWAIPLDAVISTLKGHYSLDVTEAEVHDWEDQGIIPSPTIENGEAFYPVEAIPIIKAAAEMKSEDLSAGERRASLKALAPTIDINTQHKTNQLLDRDYNRREYWSDIFPDAEHVDQVTLNELIDFVAPRLKDGERVTADTIRYWQKAGVLPQPVKRWHEGATRALYPFPYAFMAIITVLDLQKKGYTLQQIAERLRRRFSVWRIQDEDPSDWKQTALRMADEFAEITGNIPKHVQIRFIDEDGEDNTFSYAVGSDNTDW